MWESSRNNANFRGVNIVGAWINQVYKARNNTNVRVDYTVWTGVNQVYEARPPAPAPVQKAQQPRSRRFEALGAQTGTYTQLNGEEVCSS